MRVPKTPLTPISTASPGSTRLTKQVSMPALPVPDIGKRQPIFGLKDLAQHRHALIHDLEKLRIEMADDGKREGLRARADGPGSDPGRARCE